MNQNDFDHLPDEALIRLHVLISWRLVPFSTSTLWRRVKNGQFPAPIKVSESITAWRMGNVRQWLKDPARYQQPQRETQSKRGCYER